MFVGQEDCPASCGESLNRDLSILITDCMLFVSEARLGNKAEPVFSNQGDNDRWTRRANLTRW